MCSAGCAIKSGSYMHRTRSHSAGETAEGCGGRGEGGLRLDLIDCSPATYRQLEGGLGAPTGHPAPSQAKSFEFLNRVS